MNNRRLIRLPEVIEQVGLSERTLYRYVAAGTFPKPIKVEALSMRVGVEVETWVEERIAQRDAA